MSARPVHVRRSGSDVIHKLQNALVERNYVYLNENARSNLEVYFTEVVLLIYV